VTPHIKVNINNKYYFISSIKYNMALLSQEAGIATGSVFGFLLILLFGVSVYAIIQSKKKKPFGGGRRKRPRLIRKKRR
jgi:hypothetical protein